MATGTTTDRRYLVVGLSPTIQRTLQFDTVRIDEVHRALRARLDVAGKGANAARILVQIGETARHLTHAGGANRDLWCSMAREDGIDFRAIRSPGAVRNCITVLETERGTTTEFIEPTQPVDERTVEELRAAYDEELSTYDTVLVCGSATVGFPEGFHAELVAEAKKRDKRVVVDLHGSTLARVVRHRPDLIKINLREFLETFASELVDEASEHIEIGPGDPIWNRVEEQMQTWRAKGIELVCTRGARPTLYWDTDLDRMASLAPVSLRPVNTIGSGDAVTAALAARFFSEERALAIEYAHSIAAINATLLKPGSVRDDRGE